MRGIVGIGRFLFQLRVGRVVLFGIVCYGMIFVLYFIHLPLIDPDRYVQEDPTRLLNQLMPSEQDYRYLLAMVEKGWRPNPFVLESLRNYFDEVIKVSPDESDAFGLLGFCQYHLGNDREAIHAYQQASNRNPNFFWYYYNLGVIYYHAGEYGKARPVLTKALSLNPVLTVRYILASQRHYWPIVRLKGDNVRQTLEELQFQGVCAVRRLLENLPPHQANVSRLKREKEFSLQLF